MSVVVLNPLKVVRASLLTAQWPAESMAPAITSRASANVWDYGLEHSAMCVRARTTAMDMGYVQPRVFATVRLAG